MKRIQFIAAAILLLVGLASCSGGGEKVRQLQSESDLAGLTVATIAGTCYDIQLSPRSDIRLLLFKKEADLIPSLLTGQSDVVVYDETVFNSEVLKEFGLRVAFKGEEAFPTAFMFRNEDQHLIRAMNEVKRSMEEDGSLKVLEDFWLTEAYIDQKTLRHNSVETRGEPLRIAFAVNMAPIGFMVGDEWYGFEVDLLRALSTYLHRPLEIKFFDVPAAMLSLKNGLADVMCGGIFITPERLLEFSFSEPYYDFHPAYFVVDNAKEDAGSVSYWDRFKNSFRKNLIMEDRWKYITSGLAETLKITVLAILFGSLLGVVICAMTRSRRKWMQKTAAFYNWFMSGIPILVLLMILFYVVFAGSGLQPSTVAIIAFALDFAAGAGEIYQTSLNSVPHGQTEAGLALGFTRLQTFFHIVFPQALRHGLPLYQGQCVSLLKGTSIVGYIAIQDLTRAGDLIQSRTFDPFIPLLVITVLYFVLAWLIVFLLELVISSKKKVL